MRFSKIILTISKCAVPWPEAHSSRCVTVTSFPRTSPSSPAKREDGFLKACVRGSYTSARLSSSWRACGSRSLDPPPELLIQEAREFAFLTSSRGCRCCRLGPLLENRCLRWKGLQGRADDSLIQGEPGSWSHCGRWDKGFIVRIGSYTIMGVGVKMKEKGGPRDQRPCPPQKPGGPAGDGVWGHCWSLDFEHTFY